MATTEWIIGGAIALVMGALVLLGLKKSDDKTTDHTTEGAVTKPYDASKDSVHLSGNDLIAGGAVTDRDGIAMLKDQTFQVHSTPNGNVLTAVKDEVQKKAAAYFDEQAKLPPEQRKTDPVLDKMLEVDSKRRRVTVQIDLTTGQPVQIPSEMTGVGYMMNGKSVRFLDNCKAYAKPGDELGWNSYYDYVYNYNSSIGQVKYDELAQIPVALYEYVKPITTQPAQGTASQIAQAVAQNKQDLQKQPVINQTSQQDADFWATHKMVTDANGNRICVPK